MPLTNLGKSRAAKATAQRLYGQAVAQARAPRFYAELGVPDSLDGRFDMVALHVFLLLRQLRQAGAPAERLAQALFDAMFEDMDYNLRELGVGDLGVGRRVKTMAKALYGRIAAYEAGLAGDDAVLAAALARNLYGTAHPRPDQLAALCRYLRAAARQLAAAPLAALAAGEAGFGPGPD